MRIRQNIEFPCGLKYHFRIKGFFDFFSMNLDLKDCICPLHGKDCKKVK